MVLKSQMDVRSAQFRENRKACEARLSALRKALKEGDEARRSRRRGALSVQQRIEAIKDPGTEFLELSPLAALNVYDDIPCPSAGLVAGIAQVHGRPCMIVANNPMVKGGSYFPLTVKKHLRAQEIALENRLPCIYLTDSAGAYLPLQSEVFPDREGFGRIFYRQSRMSAQGIPQTAVILGSCVAGGAYIPALADENIIVKGRGTVFLAGPALVQSATGERTDKEALGGAELHCQISGLCDFMASSEEEALEKARETALRFPPPAEAFCEEPPAPPLYPEDELYGLLPCGAGAAGGGGAAAGAAGATGGGLLMREALARLLDKSELDEFKAERGKTLITGWGRILGRRVGIVAGNGPIFSESAAKGAHFIDLSSKRGIPLVFFHNTPGFMVGKHYEEGGIAKHGALMAKAAALTRTPKYTVMAGASIGAGNYALSGRSFSPRFLWSWPSSQVAVMGGDQAALTLGQVSKSLTKERAAELRRRWERESDPFYGSARLWDDGLIDPLQTRKYLALALSLEGSASASGPKEDSHPLYRL